MCGKCLRGIRLRTLLNPLSQYLHSPGQYHQELRGIPLHSRWSKYSSESHLSQGNLDNNPDSTRIRVSITIIISTHSLPSYQSNLKLRQVSPTSQQRDSLSSRCFLPIGVSLFPTGEKYRTQSHPRRQAKCQAAQARPSPNLHSREQAFPQDKYSSERHVPSCASGE